MTAATYRHIHRRNIVGAYHRELMLPHDDPEQRTHGHAYAVAITYDADTLDARLRHPAEACGAAFDQWAGTYLDGADFTQLDYTSTTPMIVAHHIAAIAAQQASGSPCRVVSVAVRVDGGHSWIMNLTGVQGAE